MTQDHLARAKDYIAKGEDYYRKAADLMQAARDEGWAIAAIAREVGRSETWTRDLLAWASNPHARDETPFSDQGRATTRDNSAAKRVVRERPEVIAEALAEAPPSAKHEIAKALTETPGGREIIGKAVVHETQQRTKNKERRVQEHGEEWHDYASEALRTLAEARVLAQKAHNAVHAAGRTEQIDERRRGQLKTSSEMTVTAFEYVKEAVETAQDFDAALAELLESS